MPSMTIKIGNTSYQVTLYDNATVQALMDKLPLIIKMEKLNGNEKYHYFPDSLPSDSRRVGNPKAGDVMLWGSQLLTDIRRLVGSKTPLDLPKHWDEGVSKSRSATDNRIKREMG